MTIRALADRHYLREARRVREAVNRAQRRWRGIPLDELWSRWEAEEAHLLTELVLRAQSGAAASGSTYFVEVAEAQNVAVTARVNPPAFTSPRDELRHWLGLAPAQVSFDLRRGIPALIAKRRGLAVLNRTVGTLVQDAGRESVGASLMLTPGMDGYYRKLRTPSCDRCVILAGEWYASAEAFLRHPNCDCVHVPAATADDYDPEMDPKEMVRQGKVTGLSEVEREAILSDEADMYRIVNAKRASMRATAMHGRRKNTPHQLFREAGGNRARYRALMRRHGYIRDD